MEFRIKNVYDDLVASETQANNMRFTEKNYE